MEIAIENYTPGRPDTRNERQRLLNRVADVQSLLESAKARSELAPDPAYSRTETRLRAELQSLEKKVKSLDEKSKAVDAAASSTAAKVARNEAYAAAKEFEKKLFAFASTALELRNKSDALAKAMAIREPGRWPHPHQVEVTLTARVIDVLGGAGNLKLPGYGSSLARQPGDISKFFE